MKAFYLNTFSCSSILIYKLNKDVNYYFLEPDCVHPSINSTFDHDPRVAGINFGANLNLIVPMRFSAPIITGADCFCLHSLHFHSFQSSMTSIRFIEEFLITFIIEEERCNGGIEVFSFVSQNGHVHYEDDNTSRPELNCHIILCSEMITEILRSLSKYSEAPITFIQ